MIYENDMYISFIKHTFPNFHEYKEYFYSADDSIVYTGSKPKEYTIQESNLYITFVKWLIKTDQEINMDMFVEFGLNKEFIDEVEKFLKDNYNVSPTYYSRWSLDFAEEECSRFFEFK